MALVVLACCTVALAVVTDPGTALAVASLTVAAGAFVAWLLRPYPPALLVAVVCLTTALSQVDGRLEPGVFLLALTAAALTARDDLDRRTTALLAVVVATPVVIRAFQGENHLEVPIWVLGIALAATLGWSVRRQGELSRRLTRTERELAEQRAAQAIQAERRRIAGDVHDVVGHAMTAMMLHVTGARHQLRHDRAAAEESLAAAEEVGRGGMRELRFALAQLSDVGDDSRSPSPSVADLEDLVASARQRGLDVELVESGADEPLEPVLGMTVYRIAQEALTNASRYAPRARTRVALTIGADSVRLRIRSTGELVASGDGDVPHLGLAGMRERARVVGGALDAGHVPDGWQVALDAPRRRPTHERTSEGQGTR